MKIKAMNKKRTNKNILQLFKFDRVRTCAMGVSCAVYALDWRSKPLSYFGPLMYRYTMHQNSTIEPVLRDITHGYKLKKVKSREISFWRKGILKFALVLIFLLKNTSKLFSRNQNYLKAALFLPKLINSFFTFMSSETVLAKFMCFTYSVQYLFGHCLTRP